MDVAPTAIGSERDGSVGAPATDGVVEPGTAEGGDPGAVVHEEPEPVPPPVVEHVPIKRKGSRKR
jgi:ribonuclease E